MLWETSRGRILSRPQRAASTMVMKPLTLAINCFFFSELQAHQRIAMDALKRPV